MKHRHKARLKPIVIAAVIALVAAACSLAGEDSAESEEAFAPTTTMAADTALGGLAASPETTIASAADTPGAGERSALGDGGVTPAVFQTTDLGRDIIFTAELTVAVNDVAAAGDEATRAIAGLGGFLFGQRTSGSPQPVSVLTFKVFPEDFQEALSRLGSIGDLRSQSVSADDVTERIVNIESRISTAEASVERLRGFLENATDIDTIAELENQLLQRETDLETMRGQLRTLQDQVALATIVLTLTQAAAQPALHLTVTAYPGHDGGGLSCPGDGDLTVDQGGEATVCFEITNVGDTYLTDFELRDPVLDLENEDLIAVFGDLAETIEPGESIIVAFETVVERNLRTRTTVTATAVDEEGVELPSRPLSSTVTMFLQAVDPGGIPSFQDGLEASWDLLVGLGQLLVLFAGSLLPFIWVPAVGWYLWRRRRTAEPSPVPPAPEREPVAAGATTED